MVTHVVGTLPYRNSEGKYNAKALRTIFKAYDVKDWIVALETGKKGYKHYQIRFDISGDWDVIFSEIHAFLPSFHLDKATDGPFDNNYERKRVFVTSRDTPDILKVRFCRLNPVQRDILGIVDSQNDREVDVWLDPEETTERLG